MKLAIALMALVMATGCPLAGTTKKVAAFSVDAAASYCKAADTGNITDTINARNAVRAEIQPELLSEHMEICLGCPGEAETFCVGEDRPKTR